ncbi:hypothetical protein FZ103_00180 [Streptomonospora sp. PA3]|uniref:hypothetical protein n=1 Tax=Streptomonospora sp. PA3 TaxID=2607326 RepID=UPI0012DBF810|nr:hypothetical protein [Streptomonospora sp. PA3]MUL39611.1 hypothetical protein [Streptomonospora sp. PA3]
MFEYRIQWRRSTWSATASTKSRIFSRERDARAFIAKLEGVDRPDLGEPQIWISRRRVGSWEPGFSGGAP